MDDQTRIIVVTVLKGTLDLEAPIGDSLANSIEDENDFRQRYAAELQKMTDKRLDDERYQVKQQAMRTPQRRGEAVKHEEIDREVVRRDVIKRR
jgi:hypothetical protein